MTSNSLVVLILFILGLIGCGIFIMEPFYNHSTASSNSFSPPSTHSSSESTSSSSFPLLRFHKKSYDNENGANTTKKEDDSEKEMEDGLTSQAVTPINSSSNSNSNSTNFELNLLKRMEPFDIDCSSLSSSSLCPEKQFFHLHHMKSGGTSVDTWLACAMSRMRNARGLTSKVPYFQLHECSGGYFDQCIHDENHTCRSKIQSSVIMSYCAPLAIPNQLGWENARAITMLRHPVDRVWSMYRFMTKFCYSCVPLKEVYAKIDQDDFQDFNHGMCIAQLMNHMTRNLMSSESNNQNNSILLNNNTEGLQDAIFNLQNRFTTVMILERLQESIDLVTHSFPWMAPVVEESDLICKFPHANSSPENNFCGPNQSHLDLPNHPDEETQELIIQHNLLDMQLYQAALNHFELQLKVIGHLQEDVS